MNTGIYKSVFVIICYLVLYIKLCIYNKHYFILIHIVYNTLNPTLNAFCSELFVMFCYICCI
jgi:hypothetical protein